MLEMFVHNTAKAARVLVFAVLFVPNAFASVEADREFLFLELQRSEREPRAVRSSERLFGLGEYYFRAGNWPQAERFFREAGQKPSADTMDLLTKMYLAEISRRSQGVAEPDEERELKESLSNKRFISVFKGSEVGRWSSVLKNDYELREYVDRLEVYLNGSLFYTVALP